MKIILIFSPNKALKNFISTTMCYSVLLLLTGDHIIIIKFCYNRSSISMAYKTVNLKESIPARLLFSEASSLPSHLCGNRWGSHSSLFALWGCWPVLTRAANTISPTCQWISWNQCSLGQIKPGKAS